MTKKWEKINEELYNLIIDDVEIGELKLNRNTNNSQAEISMLGKKFKIYKTGFWKSNLEISDNEENIISKIYGEKWYGSTYIIELYDIKLKLIVRNNPLAEWAIFDGDELVLAYGLDASKGTVGLKVTQSENNKINEENDYILDFILWYLFIPIAAESSSDDLLLSILLTSA